MPADPAPEPRRGSVGTLVGVDSPVLTELVSALGFDFLFLDAEHGELSERSLVGHVLAARVPVLARLSDSSEVAVTRAADSGVAAVVAPHVRSAEQAADVVGWAKYAPVGRRSVGLSRSTLLGLDLAAALERTDVPRVLAQIEDVRGVSAVDAICAVEGVDGLFLGPYDLSVALGAPGDFTAERFLAAVRRTVEAAHARDLLVGIFAPTPAAWAGFAALGCDYVVLRSDALLLADGAAAMLRTVRDGQDPEERTRPVS